MNEDDQNEVVERNRYEELIQTLAGRIILPKRYRIDKLLSANPYTALYRTFFEPEEKIVTLRVFRVSIKSEDDYQFKRFKQETKHLGSLKHPNIAKVLDQGMLEEGLPFVVLENLIGPTLEEVLTHQNRLESDQVVLIFSQVARALQAAHEQGVLHETLAPSRIVISETERGDAIVRTTGFGLLSLHNKLGISLKTPQDKLQFMGTAAYMSPEQCLEGAEVDGRSDIYSVGCMMYECMCGQVPFMADKQTVMQMQMEMEPTPVDVLRKDLVFPRRLLAIVNKCMQKDPTQRYQFVRDLQNDLELNMDPSEREQQTVIPEAIQKAEQRVKDNKESPVKLIGTILVVIVGVVAVLYIGNYVATMTGKLANNGMWQSKISSGKKAMEEGKVEDAGEAFKSAMIEASKFPAPDVRLAETKTELGNYDIITGRYSAALTELRSALLIETDARKTNDIVAARTLELLADAELLSNKLREAEEHARTSVTVSNGLTGDHTVRSFLSYQELFKVLIASKKLPEAKAALEKIKDTIGATDIILSMEIISGKKQAEALLKQANKDYPGAEKDYQDVLGSRQEKIGLGTFPCIETMSYLGKLYEIMGKYDKSTQILQSAFEADGKLVGDSSPILAERAIQIGQIYEEAKHKTEAEKYYRDSLEMAEKAWGKGKIDTLPFIDALAKLLRSNGQKSNAEVYEREAMEIRHPERVSKLGQH